VEERKGEEMNKLKQKILQISCTHWCSQNLKECNKTVRKTCSENIVAEKVYRMLKKMGYGK